MIHKLIRIKEYFIYLKLLSFDKLMANMHQKKLKLLKSTNHEKKIILKKKFLASLVFFFFFLINKKNFHLSIDSIYMLEYIYILL